jgi:DNA ligase D-like protein (predicted 3'-phosphoesterase)
MSLKEYKKKRDFTRTPEPREGTKGRDNDDKIYVIQRHRASHLHYDLRLEEDGVLKSWAVPKEPPVEKGIKRLAVQTEDHPLGYEKFEGVIPEGEYGAGTVEIWDEGFYSLIENSRTKKVIDIRGKRLSGHFCLIKLRKANPEDKNWLFFKIHQVEQHIKGKD